MATLLVFAKHAVPGRVKTRLASWLGPETACRVYEAFVADLAGTLRGASDVSIEWWVDGETPDSVAWLRGLGSAEPAVYRQPEGDLGWRMRLAFEDAFARRDGPVGIVGTDCPLLRPSDIAGLLSTAVSETGASVIPVEDGGYVGMALQRFVPEVFEHIPWSTSRVLEATLRALRRLGQRVQVLPFRYDVDTPVDLVRLRRDLRVDPGRAPRTAAILASIPELADEH